MLNLFRQNTFFAGLFVTVLAILLRLPAILHAVPYDYIVNAPFSSLVFDFLKSLSNGYLLSYLAATLLIIIQATLLNYTVSIHDILYKDTYLPGFFFLLLSSIYPQQVQLTPQLISTTFIILLFQRLCYLYESSNPLLLVFDAGMYLGFGILFTYDLSIFLPFILISVIIFTSFNLRYIIIVLLGILLPIYCTAVFFYLTDNLDVLIEFVEKSIAKSQFFPAIKSYDVFTPWIVLVPVSLAAAFNLQRNYFRNNVKTRRIVQCIVLLFLIAVASLFIENTDFIYSLFYLNVPLSIVIASMFISDKRAWLKEIICLVMLGMAIYFQFRAYFSFFS